VNVPFFIARRYLFARKSSNAIHILAGLSILGMGIGAAALILVMAVFNGFETLIFGLSNSFNPDIEILPREGKTMEADSLLLQKVRSWPGVAAVSTVLEENALFAYREVQDIGIIKGVDTYHPLVSAVSERMLHGLYSLESPMESHAVIGAGLAAKLGIDTRDDFEDLVVYMPNRKRSGPLDQPFLRRFLHPAGIFSVQPEVDLQYALTNLDFVQGITSQRGRWSALEVALHPGQADKKVRRQLQDALGEEVVVRDRIMQEETFLRVMNLEKWVGFAIMCLIMLLVAFNVAGTLWMVVTEKKPDIAILKTMGADSAFVQRVFLLNGLLLCGVAYGMGVGVALGFYLLQQGFGVIPVPPGFIIDAYPMELRTGDFLIVLVTVMIIGALASWLPARRAARIDAIIREE
jgi:lipoprotein-releasing system permease protein